ncbi:MAG: 23S rRNA (adenine(2030)-N(6))-methyltransferase RlmJ [Gammaproteobacteria bacterium]|nr:23S rRNA (adenine(2030)-N(6))-methyltransferase RlmJ [Gammaproteobacteria bacterium]MBT8133681.1 23S rRNA (adenine(2030)-N(6))-methyltransferase RlmJ [Gammaproteobacteria bacterium]NNJ49539.1 23S rRNA (adenine(2030)-N(6))-methyltransferase RlmJ [Gammaproteobacteria bacterium]
MLNYRHSNHAGNFGDVLKHIILIEIFEYLCQSDSRIEYIDSHAGAGLYQLDTEITDKRPACSNGIARLEADDWPELSSYFACIDSVNPDDLLAFYPGSPVIARQLLRTHDKARLYELNPAEFESLNNNLGSDSRIRLLLADGFKGLSDLVSPSAGRRLVLIDPPYEMKTDYDMAASAVRQAYDRFAAGTYVLWYPVVQRCLTDQLYDSFVNSGIKNIQRFELGITADSTGREMTASGLIVINPPSPLIAKMSKLLPRLVTTLATGEGAFFLCDDLEKV